MTDAERAAANFAQLAAFREEGERRRIPEILAEIHSQQQWLALGYQTWDEACKELLGGWQLTVSREDRREAVAELRGRGLSTRAIGTALGVSKSQVDRDLSGVPFGTPDPAPVLGLDGKTYPPKAAVTHITDDGEIPDGEPLDVLTDLGASTAHQRSIAVTQYPDLDVPGAGDEQIIQVAQALNHTPDQERPARIRNGVKWLEAHARGDLPLPNISDPIAPGEAIIAAVSKAAVAIDRAGGADALQRSWQHVDGFTQDHWRQCIEALRQVTQDMAAITHNPTVRRIK